MRILLLGLVWLCVAGGAEAQGRCTVPGRGAAVEVTVAPDGVEPFPLHVTDGLVVRPRARDHQVVVNGALAFTARAADVPMQLRRAVRLGHGMVGAGPETTVHRVRSGRDGTVRISASAGRWLTVHGLEVECADLALGQRQSGGSYSGTGTVWMPKAGQLVLRTRPGAGAAIRVAVHARHAVCFEQTARDGEWLRLRWSNPAMSLEGWARR